MSSLNGGAETPLLDALRMRLRVMIFPAWRLRFLSPIAQRIMAMIANRRRAFSPPDRAAWRAGNLDSELYHNCTMQVKNKTCKLTGVPLGFHSALAHHRQQ